LIPFQNYKLSRSNAKIVYSQIYKELLRDYLMKMMTAFMLILMTTTHINAGLWSAEVSGESESHLEIMTQAFARENRTTQDADVINLLVWNVYKAGKSDFLQEHKNILTQFKPDITMYQEALFSKSSTLCMQESDCALACSFSYEDDGKLDYTGVMTSSRYPTLSSFALHSNATEPILSTPKSTLISKVQVADIELLLVNTHGINFVSVFAFESQITEIEESIRDFDGPIIWGGDFNTWAVGRMQILKRALKRLDMNDTNFKDAHFIKKALGRKLDHVFTRGVQVLEAQAIESSGSDHNPLFLKLSL